MIDKKPARHLNVNVSHQSLFSKKQNATKCYRTYCYQHRVGTVLLLTTLTACTSPGSKVFRNIEDIYK